MVIGSTPTEQDVMLELHERAERADAENARLREALRYAADKAEYVWRYLFQEEARAGFDPMIQILQKVNDRAETALSTPADDWLERHDEEVRAEERERCAEFVEDMKLKHILSENNRIFNLSCERIAAAIREADDDCN